MIAIKILNLLRKLFKRKKKVQIPVKINKTELECTITRLEDEIITLEEINVKPRRSKFEKKLDKLKTILRNTKKYRVKKKIRKRIIKLGGQHGSL